VQILWLNLVTDGVPAIALTLEPAEPDLMRRPPLSPDGDLLSSRQLLTIGRHGLFMALGSIGLFAGAGMALGLDLERARTLCFVSLVFSQLAHALNSRADRHSLLQLRAGNPALLWGVAASVSLQVLVTSVPWLAAILRVVPLTAPEWLLASATGALPLAGMEAEKAWRRHRERQTPAS
jgi:P-type Ca2+ transporter type 2C